MQRKKEKSLFIRLIQTAIENANGSIPYSITVEWLLVMVWFWLWAFHLHTHPPIDIATCHSIYRHCHLPHHLCTGDMKKKKDLLNRSDDLWYYIALFPAVVPVQIHSLSFTSWAPRTVCHSLLVTFTQWSDCTAFDRMPLLSPIVVKARERAAN